MMIKVVGKIPVPPISEFLIEEFMKPMELTMIDLAQGTGIPMQEVYDLLHDKIEVTPELSAKLGAFFGISENVFYRLQNDVKERMRRQNLHMPETDTPAVRAV